MDNPITKALVTWWKFAVWYGVAALADALITGLPGVQLPVWLQTIFVPLVGGGLKSFATWWKTRKLAMTGEV